MTDPVRLNASAREARPWKNGGGVTAEVIVVPPGAGMDDFDWRISMATVAEAGPFSVFEGIDRHLSVLEGVLFLKIDGAEHRLRADDPGLAFAGDVPTYGEPQNGPVTDLNVMTRRGRYTACVSRLKPDETVAITTDDIIIFALEPAQVGEFELASRDALWFPDGVSDALALKSGSALLVTLRKL